MIMRKRDGVTGFIVLGLICFMQVSALSAGDLLLHWPLDEQIGQVGNDASGNGVNCVLPKGSRHHAGAKFLPGAGWNEGAVDLGSRNGIRSEASIPLSHQWALGFFFRNKTDSGRDFVRFGKLKIELGAGDAVVRLEGLGTIRVKRFTPNRWEHLAVVVEPGRATVYVNGAKAGNAEQAGWLYEDEATLAIMSVMNSPFKGLVDDVRLYRGALDAKQIAKLADGLYNADAGWIAGYTADQQKLIHVGNLNRPETDSLIEMGAPDIPTMIDALQGDDAEKCIQAAFSLGVIHNESVVDALLDVLDSDDTALVRQAVESLGRIQKATVLPRVIEMLGNSDAGVRQAARSAAAAYGDAAVPLLRDALESRSQARASGAHEVLQGLGVEPVDGGEVLRRQILDKKWAEIRKTELDDLGPLAEALSRDDAQQAGLAAKELAQRGEAALNVLLPALANGSSRGKQLAVSTLGALADPRATDHLAEVIASEDFTLQESGARALRYIAGEKQVKRLVAVLRSPHAPSRDAAVDTLVEIGSPAVEPLIAFLGKGKGNLITALFSDEAPSAEAKAAAARTLGQIGEQKAAQALIKALGSDSAVIRASAVEALGRLPQPPFAVLNMTLLEDPDWYVRWNAVQALDRLNTYDAREALGKAQEDPHPMVRQALARHREKGIQRLAQ